MVVVALGATDFLKTTILFHTFLMLAFFTPALRAQGTTFTYQDRLNDSGGWSAALTISVIKL